ncbi:MAG: ABC transporter ATP-binding protein [Acidobacteriota bacterium]|nr:ABC transporter ATP-binding protein [Acidobacteriota bacterium]MDQ7087215.1 ABC transporter ATP-binding protein [Acidobacteriota bacterium]
MATCSPTQAGAPLVYEGVSKSYRTHFWQRPLLSLDGLDLAVRPGEILGLLGPNGAGKTTTIKLALGLIFPDRGEVRLMGRRASEPAARKEVGFLPESPYFPDDLTGRELVEFAGRLHGIERTDRRRRAGEWLERVGLAAAMDRPLRKYSKGMVQRAGMARALIGNPRFVILDEPMSGLDPIGRREFRDLILGLREEGVTVLFASHVLADAEMLCDRVAILKGGKLLAVRDLGRLERERRVLRWEVEVLGGGALAGGELIAQRGDERLWRLPAEARAPEIVAAVQAGGGTLLSLTPQRETLEDLFLRTLQGAEAGDAS